MPVNRVLITMSPELHAEIVVAAKRDAPRGETPNVSGWVRQAIREKLDKGDE